MKVTPHLIRLYLMTVKRCRKLRSRLQRGPATEFQRKTLLQQLKKILRRLRALHTQLRLAAATGTVVLALNVGQAQAQGTPSTLGPFVPQNRLVNPLREPIFTNESILAVADLDQDGDDDVILGEYDYVNGGKLRYLENRSTDGVPLFIELFDTDNPLNGIHAITPAVAPTFADIDQDGDPDLFLGQHGGYSSSYNGIEYYRNDGGTFTEQTGPWDPVTKTGNPFDGMLFGQEVSPSFVDLDLDGDQDVMVGSFLEATYPYYDAKYITYYENDGTGVFTPKDFYLGNAPINYNYHQIYPTFTDFDGDGDHDMFVGTYWDGYIRYYRQDLPGEFMEETGPWDPVTKTGNPFDGVEVGQNASIAVIDFDNDGFVDLLVSDALGSSTSKYSDNIINYYRNSGNGTMVEKDAFDNPFDGVFVTDSAAPVLVDIDADGDLDAVVGNKYYRNVYDYNLMQWVMIHSYLSYYENVDGAFRQVTGSANPFDGLEIEGEFVPEFADIDGDGDADMVSGDTYGNIVLFRNNDGVYSEDATGPFSTISGSWDTAPRLVDIDGDGDLDLFLTDYYGTRFFVNDGSAQAPNYTELTGAENPLYLANLYVWGTPVLHFTDADHDGDYDAIFNATDPNNVEARAILYAENTGTAASPLFESFDPSVFGKMDSEARSYLADIDGDGDFDAFAGLINGTVGYLVNDNPSVVSTVTGTITQYDPDTGAVVIEPDLTLSDADDDPVIQAIVSIANFTPGEVLGFTAQSGITGTFDPSTGILTLRGRATVAEYQAALRTVTFEVNDPGGRTRPRENSLVDKSITFAVYDADFTTPQVISKSLQIFVNDPPTVNPQTVSLTAGTTTTLDLKLLIADPNGASDLDLATLKVTQAAPSGAVATIDASGILTLDYSALTFTGAESITVEVCDADGLCAQNDISISVVNSAPVLAPEPMTTPAGGQVTLNLVTIVTDADANLDPNSFAIVSQPVSGATASIQVVSPTEVNLLVNYQGLTFSGDDELTISVCDNVGACVQSAVAITVTNTPPVFTPAPVSATVAGQVTVNLMSMVTDADDNLDHTSFAVVSQPASGATASLQVVSPTEVNLTVNYQGLTFSGDDELTISACDQAGACVQGVLTVTVSNSPPMITPEPVTTAPGATKTIALLDITSDADDNLDPTAFVIVQQPLSGATASIQVISPTEVNLVLDYNNITFQGTDQLTIRACDAAGACSENVLSIQVDVVAGVVVYNAVAPNSTGDNKFMRITGLSQQNTVSIFNRWGDKVFEVEDYDNNPGGNVFRGLSDGGNALPSGTYFYTIDMPGQKTITGYLTLKQ